MKDRTAKIMRQLKEEHDREAERLKAEDPEWVRELLARMR